jgi:hypothetical protein
MFQALAQWWHPVAFSEAQDVLHWVMHPTSYCRIPMEIQIASEVGLLFCIVDFVVIHNRR